MKKEKTLYEMKHDGTDKQVRQTLSAWEAGDVTVDTTYNFRPFITVTAEATCALQEDGKIFNNVWFDKATVVGIMKDGRLECIGIPVSEPDRKYDNPKVRREFRFYLLVSKGVKMNPDINDNRPSRPTRHLRVLQGGA